MARRAPTAPRTPAGIVARWLPVVALAACGGPRAWLHRNAEPAQGAVVEASAGPSNETPQERSSEPDRADGTDARRADGADTQPAEERGREQPRDADGSGALADSADDVLADSTDEPIPSERVDGAPGRAGDRAPTSAEPAAPRRWSALTLDAMTLEEKVGQMIMPSVLGDYSPEGSERHARDVVYVEQDGVGGVVMSVGSPIEVAAKLNDLQRHARIPLLVAADLETGVGFRMRGAVYSPGNIDLGGATDFPSVMALGAAGDPELAYEMGRVTGVEARALGIHVPFAPVLDVNSNPANPIINVRSFGEDPDQVARMGVAFVRGMQEEGVIATGKHFPGHGDTDTDSHLELPVINHDRARMDSVELKPFREAIDAGMGGIMSGHITVPALEDGARQPATLSAAVLTGVLRSDMHFGGLLFTDAMDMGAINRRLGPREASVRAVEAGADVILMPPSVEITRQAIVRAVESGRISEERIDDSVRRILEAKERLGLDQNRFVDLERIPKVVGIPEHLAVADEIAERSITLLRNGRDLLPLAGTRSARVLSVTYRRPSDQMAGRFFNAQLRRTYRRLRTVEVDEDTNPAVYDELLRDARRQALVVVSVYVTAVASSGSVALPDDIADFIRKVGELGRPHVLISFGSPYLISEVPDVRAYMLAWGRSEASQRAAARALFGEFEVSGRVPTAIPPYFSLGEGIRLEPKRRRDGDG